MLYCVAYKYLHDSHRAEDAVHDVFIKIIDKLDSIKEIKSPQTRKYLVVITEHICINVLKSKNYSVEMNMADDKDRIIAEAIPNNYDSTEERYLEKQDVADIKVAINKLPPKMQTAMILYAVEGYSMKEIADLDCCSVESVKKRIQRARAQIFDYLDRKDSNE